MSEKELEGALVGLSQLMAHPQYPLLIDYLQQRMIVADQSVHTVHRDDVDRWRGVVDGLDVAVHALAPSQDAAANGDYDSDVMRWIRRQLSIRQQLKEDEEAGG